MSLVLITGISTSGKSTIAAELHNRGYLAYDTEHDGISAWFNKHTGARDAEFGQVPERTKEWMDKHEWRMDLDWVNKMAAEAAHNTIFLCGGGSNEVDVRELCDKTIWLKTDEATIKSRVNNPRDHTYGTEPHELERILQENTHQENEHQQFGALVIDARRPITKVVEDILAQVKRLGLL
jgi:shikimate kinase